MECYKIEDLKIAKYEYQRFYKISTLKRLVITNERYGVLVKTDVDYYYDLINNWPVWEKDIIGTPRSFIATNELLSRSQIMYIFDVLTSGFNFENNNGPTNVSETSIVNGAVNKIKSIGSKFRKK